MATTRHQLRTPTLSPFAKRLLISWRRLNLPTRDNTVVAAVSGGADSSAMVLGIDELIRAHKLNVQLVVAHLDHGLRKDSRRDARWVKDFAAKLGFESVLSRSDVAKAAKSAGDNLEQAARRARYAFLARTAKKHEAKFILTAHTMDDQAETVLLRLLRGSGSDGMGGIEPLRQLNAKSKTELMLARPLLTWARRSDIESYCRQRGVDYLSDPMNKDEQFARVRVRRQLLPLMESFNARIVEGLSRTAELLRDELDVLTRQADALLAAASSVAAASVATSGKRNKSETIPASIDVRVLADAPVAVRRRALRRWISNGRGDLRRYELAHIQAIERLLRGQQGGRVAELPGGDRVVRRQSRLELLLKT